MSRIKIKKIAAFVTIIGVIFSIAGKFFRPSYLMIESVTFWDKFIPIVGWAFLIVAPIIYIWADWPNLFLKNKDDKPD